MNLRTFLRIIIIIIILGGVIIIFIPGWLWPWPQPDPPCLKCGRDLSDLFGTGQVVLGLAALVLESKINAARIQGKGF